jgi:hypothetical protein
MATNKNGLHDIVMTYIPTKKTNNLQLKNHVVTLPIFKGPIPTLHPTVKPDDEKKPELKSYSVQKINIIKETTADLANPNEIPKKQNIEPTNGGGSRSKPISKTEPTNGGSRSKPISKTEPTNGGGSRSKPDLNLESTNGGGSRSKTDVKLEPTNGGGSRSKPISKTEPTNGGGIRSKPALKLEAKDSSKKNNSSDKKTKNTQISSKPRLSRSNHIASTHLFDLEQTSHKNSFRNVAIKFNSKNKKKRSRSKKSSKKISKKKSSKNNLNIKKNVPTNLRVDLEKLLNDDDKIILQRL